MNKIIILLAIIIFVGCTSPTAELLSEEEMEQAIAETLTAMPQQPVETEGKAEKTLVVAQTQNAKDQATLDARPTSTPLPTNTAPPTNTPEPTATPTEIPTPTPLPDPIYLLGSDDSVVDFENPFSVSLVRVIGNSGGNHFALKGHDVNKDSYELLVNTTDPYEGIILLDRGDTHTTRFEITATGQWEITVDALQTARKIEAPGSIDGSGDDVIVLIGGTPDLANIRGNEGANHFAIKGYGSSRDLLVNTTDPYDGTVILASDTVLFEINSEGLWSIEVTIK